ncbi:MAG: hypothetical protein IAE97_00245 [Chthoniobacterales bacterium]|nr:hypothetical protein [Chthoniobacterales bacterium]
MQIELNIYWAAAYFLLVLLGGFKIGWAANECRWRKRQRRPADPSDALRQMIAKSQQEQGRRP